MNCIWLCQTVSAQSSLVYAVCEPIVLFERHIFLHWTIALLSLELFFHCKALPARLHCNETPLELRRNKKHKNEKWRMNCQRRQVARRRRRQGNNFSFRKSHNSTKVRREVSASWDRGRSLAQYTHMHSKFRLEIDSVQGRNGSNN